MNYKELCRINDGILGIGKPSFKSKSGTIYRVEKVFEESGPILKDRYNIPDKLDEAPYKVLEISTSKDVRDTDVHDGVWQNWGKKYKIGNSSNLKVIKVKSNLFLAFWKVN